MKAKWKAFKDWYLLDFARYDLIVSTCLAAAIIGLIWRRIGVDDAVKCLKENSQSIYNAITAIAGSLFGFVLAAVTIAVSYVRMPQMKLILDQGHMPEVMRCYFRAVGWLAATSMWGFVGMIADTKSSPRPIIGCIMLWLFMVTATRVYRCVDVLGKMVYQSLREEPPKGSNKP